MTDLICWNISCSLRKARGLSPGVAGTAGVLAVLAGGAAVLPEPGPAGAAGTGAGCAEEGIPVTSGHATPNLITTQLNTILRPNLIINMI